MTFEPLAAEDGGGFVATAPDLPGCMSDAARDALAAWIDAAELGHQVPTPSRRLARAG